MRKQKPNRTLSVVLLVVFSGMMLSGAQEKAARTAPASSLTARQKVVHALNRLTFGLRPGEVERVQAEGLDKWIDQQLHPERIADDLLNSRLASFPTLKMDTREMVENYPPPQVIRAIAEGRMSLPSDPEKRAAYEAQLERYRRRQQAQSRQKSQSPDGDSAARTLPPDGLASAGESMAGEDRTGRMSGESVSPEQRRMARGMVGPQQVVTQAAQAKLLRAVYSERQLEEVLTDFWFNHFNVFIGKGLDRYLVISYERDVIRPHVFGKFEDMLVATAKSPAMLWYLDNWQSVGPKSRLASGQALRGGTRQRRARPNQQPQQAAPRGLNENYARELMELHTIGVDAGYTQKDVTEVARVFSGWTLREPRRGGGYMFRSAMHDPGAKTVLGKRISEDGEKEGLQVLEMLARHPATARFISTKLAQRFVADDPPAALIDRMSATFTKTGGDLREVYRSMLRAPEFWEPSAYRAKVKTPLEFVASAIRASGAEVSNAMPLVRTLNEMGMPLYGAQPPTGYSSKAENWVNSAALLSRMNFAVGLASGRLPGVSFSGQQALGGTIVNDGDRQQLLDSLGIMLFAGELSPQTTATIHKQLQSNQSVANGLSALDRSQAVNLVTGLLLGSPEFQRR